MSSHVAPKRPHPGPRSLVIALLVAAGAAVPASAQAADACRASAARVTLPQLAASEPVVANSPASPCASDARELAGAQPVGELTVSLPRAATRRESGVIAASATVEGAQLGGGATSISVGAVRSRQVASCAEGRTVASGSSEVDALVVGGTPVPIVADRPVDLQLGPVRVRANQLEGATRRALVIDDADGRQIVLGEAAAGGDACAAGSQAGSTGGPGSGPGAGSQICAEGAEYDVESNTCVIREDADGGADGKQETIVIGHPYEGQRGGSVLSLDEARQRVAQGALADSPCLRGKGPEFVVLGSSGRDVITGANTSDRILVLAGNDRVSGGVGDDCIDGGRGADRLTGDNGDDVIYGRSGNDELGGSADADRLYAGTGRDVLQGGDGKDRVSGGSGRDAVNGGSGTDRLNGGSGNDTLNTGFGKDRVNSGSGRDSINASTAGPASRRIRCGKGHDTLRINRNERRRSRGCETVYTIR